MRGGKFQREGLGIESKIVQCLNCSLVYPNPFPEPKSLESLYGDTNDYFSKKESWEARSKTYENLVEAFIQRIDSDSKTHKVELLDIGAGRGEFCQAARSFPNINCTGIEVSAGSIKYAQEKGIELYRKSLRFHILLHFHRFLLHRKLEHLYQCMHFLLLRLILLGLRHL